MANRNLDSDGDATGWGAVGQGIAVALIILAIGGCTWLGKQNGPLVIVRHESGSKQ